jgi:putative flippase GtrA
VKGAGPDVESRDQSFARVVEARSLTRFVLVGISNTAISYGTFWIVSRLLPDVPWRYGLAQLASYPPGLAWSYVWNRQWSFGSSGAHRTQLWRFVASQVAFAVLSAVGVNLSVATTPFSPSACWAGVTGIVMVLNYLTMRHWVFRER